MEKLKTNHSRFSFIRKQVFLRDLDCQMIFDEDVKAPSGMLLIAKGHAVTPTLKHLLKRLTENLSLSRPVYVLVPVTSR